MIRKVATLLAATALTAAALGVPAMAQSKYVAPKTAFGQPAGHLRHVDVQPSGVAHPRYVQR